MVDLYHMYVRVCVILGRKLWSQTSLEPRSWQVQTDLVSGMLPDVSVPEQLVVSRQTSLHMRADVSMPRRRV